MLDRLIPSSRSWAVLLLLLTMMGVFALTTPITSWAQEPAADAATAETPETAPAAAPAASETPAAPQTESFLSWMIRASGMFGLILLLLSFLMVAIIMMNVLQVRRDSLLPPSFVEAFESKLAGKDYQGAYETARNDDSFIARVLAAGLSRLNRGYSEAVEGMQEVGEEEAMAMEHKLSYLTLIGSIAPMIGLMGTVYGMIQVVLQDRPIRSRPQAEGAGRRHFDRHCSRRSKGSRSRFRPSSPTAF